MTSRNAFLRDQRFSLSILATLLSASSFAGEMNSLNRLQVSGGIAAPATSTSVFTNPAGLVAAPTALVLQAAAPSFWDNGTYRAGLQTGGSSFGAAAGLERIDRARNDATLGYYGFAVGVPAFSLGLAGRTGISNANGSTFNAGLLFSAGSNARVGITAIGLDDGVNEWGAGVGFTVTSGVVLVLDAAANDHLKNIELKPGMKIESGPAALTVSYGTGDRAQFADGFTAGGSYQFSAGNVLELQYNAGGSLSKYFAALTIGF